MEILGLGFLFWIGVIVAAAIILAFLEYEKYGVSFVTVLAASVGLLYLSGHTLADAITYVRTNPSTILTGILVYFSVGIVYGVVKWGFFLGNIRERLVEWRADRKIPSGPLTEENRRDSGFRDIERAAGGHIPPQVRSNKARLTGWMAYWPISLPWTLLNDPIKKFFNMVYNRLGGMLQSMSDRSFKDIG